MAPKSPDRLNPLRENYGILLEGSNAEFDPIAYGIAHGALLLDYAAAAQRMAVHYDGETLVGAALLAHDPEAEEIGVFLGYNNTPYKGAKKFCAEMKSRSSASGYPSNDMSVIVAPNNAERIKSINEHGRPTATLPPCKPCRTRHIKDGLLICTVDSARTVMQAWTHDSLKAYFKQSDHTSNRRGSRKQKVAIPRQPKIIDLTLHEPEAYWSNASHIYLGLRNKLPETERHDQKALAALGVRALNLAGREVVYY